MPTTLRVVPDRRRVIEYPIVGQGATRHNGPQVRQAFQPDKKRLLSGWKA